MQIISLIRTDCGIIRKCAGQQPDGWRPDPKYKKYKKYNNTRIEKGEDNNGKRSNI